MARHNALVLCRMIYRSADSHRGSVAPVKILLWADFYLELLKLLSSLLWTLGH
jgi:hypothetical protein